MRISFDIPPGLNGDDTTYAAAGRWADASNVRFYRGRPQVIGGWESLTTDLLTGVCRNVFNWSDNDGSLNIAFGTHSALQVWVGGGLYDITPALAMPSATLGANPLAVTDTSAVVSVTHAGHGLETADTIIVSGAAAIGGITPNGGPFAITKVNDNSYTFTFTSPATSTVAGGGGSAVAIAPQQAFVAGAVDGAGGSGYGTGSYGVGEYSEPSTAEFYPRTWALSAFGENLVASPRGGTVHLWANNTGSNAAPLANAPRNATHMVVAPQDQIFALGCNEEVSGEFNALCIRHCGVRASSVWNTSNATTAREYVLPGGGRIVAGRIIGSSLLVWTNHALFLGTYVGSLAQPWRFDRVGANCGLIGPNAAVVVGQTAFWLGPDLQFYRYGLGAAPGAIECPIRTDFVENLTPTQSDKISAGTTSSYTEIRWDYPDGRDGVENSRYLSLNTTDGSWSKGVMDRTAWCDAGPSQDPIGVTPAGNAYWHERGASADGSAFAWLIESADQYLDENSLMRVNGVWPDIGSSTQIGPVYVTLTSRLKPQGDERVFGPYGMAVGQAKVDVRASGRLFKVKFSGNSLPTAARLGRPIFDVERLGRR